MSKKETEFDRFDRMKKLEREAEATKRKSMDFSLDRKKKKAVKGRTKNQDLITEEDYDYV